MVIDQLEASVSVEQVQHQENIVAPVQPVIEEQHADLAAEEMQPEAKHQVDLTLVAVDPIVPHTNLEHVELALEDDEVEELNDHLIAALDQQLAIVPYQPPLIQPHQVFIGMVRVVKGPALLREMIWKKSFLTLLPEFDVLEVLRPISCKPWAQ